MSIIRLVTWHHSCKMLLLTMTVEARSVLSYLLRSTYLGSHLEAEVDLKGSLRLYWVRTPSCSVWSINIDPLVLSLSPLDCTGTVATQDGRRAGMTP